MVFEKKMSLSKYGMRTSIWGAPGWVFIQSIVRAYPHNPSVVKQKRYGIWIHGLKDVLPCAKCCQNMKRHLIKLHWKQNKQHYMSTRDSLSRFLHTLHNMVNQELNKAQIQYENFIDMFESFRTKDGISSCVWGQAGWLFLGCIARNYPIHPTKKQQRRYARWFNSLKYVLPDKPSRKNMRQLMKALQWRRDKWQYLADRDSLSRFIHTLHNMINYIIHKPVVDYESFVTLFDSFRAKCDPATESQCEEDVFSTFTPMQCHIDQGVIHIIRGTEAYRLGTEK